MYPQIVIYIIKLFYEFYEYVNALVECTATVHVQSAVVECCCRQVFYHTLSKVELFQFQLLQDFVPPFPKNNFEEQLPLFMCKIKGECMALCGSVICVCCFDDIMLPKTLSNKSNPDYLLHIDFVCNIILQSEPALVTENLGDKSQKIRQKNSIFLFVLLPRRLSKISVLIKTMGVGKISLPLESLGPL